MTPPDPHTTVESVPIGDTVREVREVRVKGLREPIRYSVTLGPEMQAVQEAARVAELPALPDGQMVIPGTEDILRTKTARIPRLDDGGASLSGVSPKMPARPVRWPDAEWNRVTAAAKKHGKTISELVRTGTLRHVAALDGEDPDAVSVTPSGHAGPPVGHTRRQPDPPPATDGQAARKPRAKKPAPAKPAAKPRRPRVPDKTGRKPLPLVKGRKSPTDPAPKKKRARSAPR